MKRCTNLANELAAMVFILVDEKRVNLSKRVTEGVQ